MKRKNLIFIFADQWARDAVGYRNSEISTPNIDDFYRDSLNVTNAVSACPLCSPNRAAILTGRYPITNGVWTNCKTGLNVELPEEEVTIGNILKDNNYNTGYIGKWHLDIPDANKEMIPVSGAKNWDAYTPPGPRRRGFDFWYSYGADDNHLKPHYWKDSSEMIEVDQWSVEHETQVAMEFLERNKERNFALFLSWNPPHTPLDLLPEKYMDIYRNRELKVNPNIGFKGITDHTGSMAEMSFTPEEYQDIMRKYYGAVSGIDENFGRLMEYLKKEGLYDDTLIVLTADHGELLCAHSLWSKHVWYEESIGVPFLIRQGEDLARGDTDTVLNGVDIMPTLLSLLQLEIPEGVEGRDLSEAIKGGRVKNEAFIGAYPGQVRAIKELGEKDLDNLAYGWRGVRDGEYLYVVNRGYSRDHGYERLLYNLKEDPYQMNPLDAGKAAGDERVKRYEEKLEKWIRKHNDPFVL